MSGEDDGTVDQEALDNLPDGARKHLRQVEKELRGTRDELAELRTMRQQFVAQQAGLDITSGTGRLFADAYKGDWTKDAVTAAMAEYGLKPSTQSTQANGAEGDQQEQRQAQRDQLIDRQSGIGADRFGDLRPAGHNTEQAFIGQMVKAVNDLGPDYTTEQSVEAIRAVMHEHKMVMMDEV